MKLKAAYGILCHTRKSNQTVAWVCIGSLAGGNGNVPADPGGWRGLFCAETGGFPDKGFRVGKAHERETLKVFKVKKTASHFGISVLYLRTWKHSSAGMSARLTSGRPRVRAPLLPFFCIRLMGVSHCFPDTMCHIIIINTSRVRESFLCMGAWKETEGQGSKHKSEEVGKWQRAEKRCW